MTRDELCEVLAEALDAHKARTQAAYKVDQGRQDDGARWLCVDLPGGECLRITVEERPW